VVATTLPRVRSSTRAPTAVAPLATWAVILATGYLVVRWLPAASKGIHVNAPPLVGSVDWRPDPTLLLPLAVAAAVVVVGPSLAARLTWRRLMLATTATALVWPVALALLDGGHALARPVVSNDDYLAAVASVGTPASFLEGYVDRIAAYPVHVQGHPPGLVLVLWALERAGLGGSGAATALYLGGGAAAAPAVLVAARDVAGEDWARRAAPFVVLAPAAVWMATSADALFAGVGAWAVALVVLATGRPGRGGDGLAVGGGVLFGMAAFLSYGLVLLVVIPLAVAYHRRRLRPLIAAAVPGAAVAGVFLALGFWWVDGLAATRDRYFTGIGGERPYAAFAVANIACLAIALGPTIAVALARLRDRRVWLLVGGALGAVALADLSGLSKGEVERIWLPFVPWILLAAGALAIGAARRARSPHGWLGLQAATALTLQTLVHTPW
jgi:methylthioxylose transferase